MVDNYAAFFNCTPVGRASDFMMARLKAIHLSWLGPELLVCCWPTGVQLVVFFCFDPESVGYSAPRDLHRRAAYSICESWFLIHQDVYRDLFVCS